MCGKIPAADGNCQIRCKLFQVPLQKSLPIDIGKTLGDDSADCGGCQAGKLNAVAAKEGNPINVATGNKLQIEKSAIISDSAQVGLAK